MPDKHRLVTLENVQKHYPVKKKTIFGEKEYVKAVNGVTMDILEGETMSVVGESGCGKSTLGRSILQLETLTDGTVKFDGTDLNTLTKAEMKKTRKEMQMIFQDPFASLDPRQKIGSALEEPLKIHTNMSTVERQNKVESLLKEVGLRKEHANRYPHEFSGGQRQRIGIARAISLNPKFIVLDEAVSALDVSVQAQVIELLQNLQQKYNLTYLFISHDLGVVRYISDRVLVMYLGHMVEMAPVDALYSKPLHPYTQVLLSAIPRARLGGKTKRIKVKEIDMDNSQIEQGCPFVSRCPIATNYCKEVKPDWREIEKGHFVACHEV